MRPDIFPPDLISALGELRQEAPRHSLEETRRCFRAAFERELEDVFEEFAQEPIASGSVGQVYRARLRDEYALGERQVRDVAVKVQHPTVLDETYVDMLFLRYCVPLLNFGLRVAGSEAFISVPFCHTTFHHSIRTQLDFNWEAYNLLVFQRNFYRELAETPCLIKFPEVSTTIISDTVLVEEWSPGKTVSELVRDMPNALPTEQAREELSTKVHDMMVKMFLRDNFIHGDLHSGNLLYDTETKRITVLDAGLVTRLPVDDIFAFGEFLQAICNKDADSIADHLFGFRDPSVPLDKAMPRDAIRDDLAQIWITGVGRPDNPDTNPCRAMGDAMGQILKSLSRYGIMLRGDIAAGIMTISVSEGLIMGIYPDFDILNKTVPYFVRYRDMEANNLDELVKPIDEQTKKLWKETMLGFQGDNASVMGKTLDDGDDRVKNLGKGV